MYDAWGLFGQHDLEVAILKNFQLIDPQAVPKPTALNVRKMYSVGGVKVLVENLSDESHKRYAVYVPRELVLAVYHELETPGNSEREVKIVSEEVKGAEVYEKELKDLKQTEENKKIYYVYTARVVKLKFADGREQEVVVARDYKGIEREVVGKPKIIVRRLRNGAEIYGDTYFVRDYIKVLHGKWDASTGAWKIEGADANEIARKLGEVAEVELR